jgi:hypothetical protein
MSRPDRPREPAPGGNLYVGPPLGRSLAQLLVSLISAGR